MVLDLTNFLAFNFNFAFTFNECSLIKECDNCHTIDFAAFLNQQSDSNLLVCVKHVNDAVYSIYICERPKHFKVDVPTFSILDLKTYGVLCHIVFDKLYIVNIYVPVMLCFVIVKSLCLFILL